MPRPLDFNDYPREISEEYERDIREPDALGEFDLDNRGWLRTAEPIPF